MALPKSLSRMNTTPIAVVRSRRAHIIRGLTSLPAGKVVPIHVIPLLREDKLDRCSFRLSFEMMETVEVLMNAVNVNVKAYLVSHVAHSRFSGMDELNRSFSGVANQDGGQVTPYFNTGVGEAVGVNKIHEYMGKHVKTGTTYNTTYVEDYNIIWNFRAKNRSPDIQLRSPLDVSLAPAFWQHEQFSEIVPDFDQAIIDGEIPLNVVNGKLAVKQEPNLPLKISYPHTTPTVVNQTVEIHTDRKLGIGQNAPASAQGIRLADPSNLFAELNSQGITVSLSNIELARKTQAFARLRQQFQGHSDEYIIDMLMDGLTIPEQAFMQPILLAEKSTVFGMSKRYASDAENLTESVVNGLTFIDMTIRCPQVPMGGVIMITAEITPEQLFERQKDPFLHLTSPEDMPHYLEDTLDPEKVQAVRNDYVDVAHDTPAGTFGYAPLNHQWNHNTPGIGGKFFRPTVNTSFDEARQRIWAVETVNPVLSADFYLCNNMHTKPFVVTNQDPFEVVIRGEGVISGNTVFGARLVEMGPVSQWDEVLEEVDQTRLPAPAEGDQSEAAKQEAAILDSM